MTPHHHSIEPLEARIAPAVVIANPTTGTYTDVDGDAVTIKVSAGTLTAGLFLTADAGVGEQLQAINLSGGGFDKANLTLTVKKSATGDGLAHVGFINSLNHDLGLVTIPGDLGQIDAGDSDPAAPALKTLNVRSLGRLGLATQAAGGSLQSDLIGAVGALTVKGDVAGAYFFVNDAADGTIGALTIGGDLRGGSTTNSGLIFSSGNMGAVKITGSILGGTGLSSGKIQSTGKLASVTVGGSIFGNAGDDSGQLLSTLAMGAVKIGGDLRGDLGVRSGLVESLAGLTSLTVTGSILGGKNTSAGAVSVGADLGPVVVGGDLTGGSASQSGSISAVGKFASATIGGSVTGGSDSDTGEIKSVGNMGAVKIGGDLRGGTNVISGLIECAAGNLASVTIGGSVIGGPASSTAKIVANVGTLGPVKIGRDLVGGSVTGADSANGTGYLQGQRITSVSIGGSIVAGTDTSTGALTQSGSIRAIDDLGPVTVKGSLIGNALVPVILSGRGQPTAPTGATDLAIASLTVGGRVEYAEILAGYDVNRNPISGDAQIGTIKVGGDWIASSASAGVDDGGDGFGNANDALIPDGLLPIARIAAIQIGGIVLGTASAGDHFGFVAQQIGSFKALGFSALLTAAKDTIELSLLTADVTIREVP